MSFLVSLNFLWGFLSISLSALCFYVAIFYFQYFTRPNPLPGPIPIPLFGNLLQLGSDIAKNVDKVQAQYGDFFEVYFGPQRTIWLGRADLVEKLTSTSKKSNFFYRTPLNHGLDELDMQFSGMVFNRDYDSWRFNRKILSQSLMSRKFNEQVIANIQRLFAEAGSYWAQLGNNCELDFIQWSLRFTSDVTLTSVTGKRDYSLALYYNTLVSDDKKVQHPSPERREDLLMMTLEFFKVTSYYVFFPYEVRHYIPGFRQLNQKHAAFVDKYYKAILGQIQKKREEINNIPLGQPLGSDLLTLLVTANTKRDPNSNRTSKKRFSRCLTDKEIRQTFAEAIGGGIETTANSLCYIIYYLCKNPRVKAKLIDEIQGNFEKDFTSIPLETLENLEYCEAIIKEVSRLIPTSPFIARQIKDDDEVGGYTWKAGTVFYIHAYGIQKSEKHWDDPETFYPERFLRRVNRNGKIEKNSFFPFGGGLRICPGRQIAMIELKALMVLLFGKYNVELANNSEELKYSFIFVNHCESLNIYLSPK